MNPPPHPSLPPAHGSALSGASSSPAGASSTILAVRDLTKSFNGVPAVRGLSFEISAGSVVGFIGANGSGKTTTMRMIATLELPDSGTISVAGRNAVDHPEEVRRLIGWMPDAYGAYPHMSVGDYLDFFARMGGLRGAARGERVREVMAFCGVTELAARPMNGLSKGMAQRLCLGRALLQKPPILVMDEPAAGLDPVARMEFKASVAQLKQQGVTAFISSHILSELEEMCDALLFIDQGRIVHQGAKGSLHAAANGVPGTLVEIRVAGGTGGEAALLAWISTQPGWHLLEQIAGGVRARFTGGSENALALELRHLVSAGVAVVCFQPHQKRLEEIFVDVLKTRHPGPSAHTP